MIIGEIKKVSDTNILVAKIQNKFTLKNYQLTVYSNKVNTINPVAMVLPYPNKNLSPLVIETNKNDNNVYDSININCFERLSLSKSNYSGDGTFGLRSNSVLKVLRSGSYRYSIANGIDDIKRIDQGVFNIKSGLQKLLKSYSNQNFGFLVCIIDKNVDYTPFAYITDLCDNTFFIPTKHYHDHDIHSNYDTKTHVFNNPPDMNNPIFISAGSINSNSNITDDWDHSIYVIGARNRGWDMDQQDFKSAHTDLNINSLSHKYSFSKYLNDLTSCNKENLLKITKKGSFENIDFIIPAF